MVELWDRRDDRVRTFSGGMKRRLEIARGLLHRPRVLFLDEPTIGLDPQTRRRIWDYLGECAPGGLTIFLTTHYMDEAEHCDRIAIIDHGKIVALDTPAGLKRAGRWRPDHVHDQRARGGRDRNSRRVTVSSRHLLIARSASRCRPGEAFLPEFVRTFGQPMEAIGLRRPTLDDVFIT